MLHLMFVYDRIKDYDLNVTFNVMVPYVLYLLLNGIVSQRFVHHVSKQFLQ